MTRILCIAALTAALAPSLAVSEVEFMSRKYFQNVDGNRYWEVKLTCEGETTEKLMKRVVGENNDWCSVDTPSLCNESTFVLSELICGATENEIAAKVALLDKPPATEPEAVQENQSGAEAQTNTMEQSKADLRNALVLEQVEIEEKRIQIEQRRLELAQRELELKKQLAN